jgi:hypothetical protein
MAMADSIAGSGLYGQPQSEYANAFRFVEFTELRREIFQFESRTGIPSSFSVKGGEESNLKVVL